MTPELALCFAENAKYLVLSSHVPKLIYYTHLTALVLSLLVGLFVYLNDRKSLTNKILFLRLFTIFFFGFFYLLMLSAKKKLLFIFFFGHPIVLSTLFK